ncbi:RAMP superfamily CRISPR-associated protein [Candidatus Acidulodesulfobacterium sp. H_13]|uniref:RAMP superfamily CRISPR-associated protein n=1 Tax=Candidatus Acidulodesulfobacterium sp. H_13 TaxID=3395470 RepID=UPI003AF54218
MAEPFVKKTYFAMTLDPVHIGTGGYRLGRVDNTITREPGTNLPKIPGSSIAGVTRAYTAMAIQNGNFIEIKDGKICLKIYSKLKYQRPAYQLKISDDKKTATVKKNPKGELLYLGDKPEEPKYYSCAGKGADDGEGHCGNPDCEVCVSFGFSKGKSNLSFQGLTQFYDARILFFPVHSMIGPVWVTSPSILMEHNKVIKLADLNKFKSFGRADLINNGLNFGWLMLESEGTETLDDLFPDVSKDIKDSLFVVSDKIFSRIVNDNLEVRTSVAIDPATGAAEDGALYTYEAIPRATVMWFDVVYNKPEYFRINGQEIMEDVANKLKADSGWIQTNVEKGLAYFEYLGIGGMNTRGMGRLRILNMGGQSNGNT